MAEVNVFAYQGGDAKGNKASSANSKTKTKDDDIVAEVDNELQDGPVFKRSCTDCLCCPLFVVFCAGLAWALIYGVSNGDPYKLITLYDYDGNGCGYSSATKNYPYMYWPVITFTTSYKEIAYKNVCVKRCPTVSNSLASTDCYTNSIVTSCTSGTSYDSTLYLDKFCIPDTSSASSSSTYTSFKSAVMDDYGGNYITTYMADVFICWWVFIVAAFVAFFFRLYLYGFA